MNFSIKSINSDQNKLAGSLLLISKTDEFEVNLTLKDVRKTLIKKLKVEAVKGNFLIVNNALCRFGFIISDDYIKTKSNLKIILKDIEKVVNNASGEDLDGNTFRLSEEIIEISGVQ